VDQKQPDPAELRQLLGGVSAADFKAHMERQADLIRASSSALADAAMRASASWDKFGARWRDLRSDPTIAADLDEWETEFP
jgi:hypothetical protein